MTAPPGAPIRPLGRAAALRFAVLALFVLGGFLALRYTPLSEYTSREELLALFETWRSSPAAPLILIGLYLVISPVGLPVSPLVFAAGAVFGVLWGWVINWVGIVSGALVSYLLARALGRDLVVRLLGASRVERLEAALERHAFWGLARIRLLPLPFVLVNYGSALAGVRLPVFLGATALGYVPSMLLYTYLGYALGQVATGEGGAMVRNATAALILLAAITFIPALVRRGRGKPPD